MDNTVTHIVRLDPEGTSEEERERLQAEFAALLASGQPLLESTPVAGAFVGLDPRDAGTRVLDLAAGDPAAAQDEGHRA